MLDTVFMCSLICTFWYALFWEDMVFESIGDYMSINLPSYITKPLFECLTCMSGAWGLVFAALFLDRPGVIDILKFIFCLGGMNAIIHAYLNFLLASKNFYENGHQRNS